MKVKITYTVQVSESERRGIAKHFGDKGLASRKDVKHFLVQNGKSGLDDAAFEATINEK